MLFRRAVRTIHRWLGLAIGLFVVLMALTGGVLVFAHPLDRWLNPALFERSEGPAIGFDAAHAAVRRRHPDREIALLWSPLRHGVYEAVLRGEPSTVVFVDAGSGRILGTRQTERSLVGLVTALHVSLLGGSAGESIVGCLGAAWLALLATGAYLWWPGWRRVWLAFRVRWHKNRFAALYDLHKLTGAVTLPVVAIIVLSGFFLTFNSLGKGVVHGITGSRPLEYPSGEALRCQLTSGARLRPEALQAAAERAVPGAEAIGLVFPPQEDLAVQVRLQPAASPHPNGFARVWLNPYDGAVLHKHDPGEFNLGNNLYAKWMFPLHIGSYAGAPSKWLHAGVSLAPPFLALSGLLMWRKRRQRRQPVAPQSSLEGDASRSA